MKSVDFAGYRIQGDKTISDMWLQDLAGLVLYFFSCGREIGK